MGASKSQWLGMNQAKLSVFSFYLKLPKETMAKQIWKTSLPTTSFTLEVPCHLHNIIDWRQ